MESLFTQFSFTKLKGQFFAIEIYATSQLQKIDP